MITWMHATAEGSEHRRTR